MRSAEMTDSNSQGAYSFNSEIKSARQKRDKITIQRNSALQHKVMTSLHTPQRANNDLNWSYEKNNLACWIIYFL